MDPFQIIWYLVDKSPHIYGTAAILILLYIAKTVSKVAGNHLHDISNSLDGIDGGLKDVKTSLDDNFREIRILIMDERRHR